MIEGESDIAVLQDSCVACFYYTLELKSVYSVWHIIAQDIFHLHVADKLIIDKLKQKLFFLYRHKRKSEKQRRRPTD